MPRNFFALQKIAAKNAAIVNANNAAYKAALNNPQFFVIPKQHLATLQGSKAVLSKAGNIYIKAIFNTRKAAWCFIFANSLRLAYTVYASN